MSGVKRPGDLTELHDDRELAWRIIQHVPAGIVHVRADGAIESANPTALAMLGFSYDELTQRYTRDFETETIWEDGSPCPVEDYPVTQALRTGEPQPEALIGVRRPDGELSWALFTAIPVKEPETGTTTGAVVTILDITHRKRIEAALRDSEEMLRSVITSAPSVIVTADRDGIVQFVSRSNDPDGSPESYLGRSIYDMPRPRDVPVIRACVERVIASGQPDGCEVQVDRGGTPIAYSVRIGPLMKDDEVAGISMLATDVTELKALQNQVMISDRLASIGTLAAGVAHEINNPLTYVIMSLQQAKRALHDERPEALSRALTSLDAALEGSNRIGRVVRDLGELSRPPEDENQPVDLHDVLELAIHMSLNETRYRARVVRDYRAVSEVSGDKSRLGQVFLNLLVNAAQAIDAGDVASNEIRVSTVDTGAGQVEVTVSDTGRGIPAELIGHVFEPFVTGKDIGEGTGLGLYICHKIVTALGGTLGVRSRAGYGATITVTLPAIVDSSGAQSQVAELLPAPHTPLDILVVDDEPLIVGFFEEELARHQLVVARSGREGIEILRDRSFDLVFCDLIMPDLTGMDIHEFLGRENPAQRDAMVFMTGGAFTTRAKEFLRKITNPVLKKPFTLQEIERLIDDAVRRRCAAGESSA